MTIWVHLFIVLMNFPASYGKAGGGWGFGWLCSDLQLEVIVVYELESEIGSVIH